MNKEQKVTTQDLSTVRKFSPNWSGLQARMAFSYVWVTVACVLLLLIVIGFPVMLLRILLGESDPHNPPLVLLGGFGLALLAICVLIAGLSAPIGGIFGLVTTRGMVRRLRELTTTATLFADGNYQQRVIVRSEDEIGQLERQFNRMAQQLVESMMQREVLAEQNARLAERERLSRELHDAISQDLFSLRMLVGGLQTALPPDSPFQPQITALGTTTTNMLRAMRALLLELRPLPLEELGLAEGLKELATGYSTRLGITVNIEIAQAWSSEEGEQLSTRAQHALLRISQEALANAVRHANATCITLSLADGADGVTLVISDNGNGFHPHEDRARHGLGLRLMRERIQELSGTFRLQTAPGQGTSLHVYLPQERACDSCSNR